MNNVLLIGRYHFLTKSSKESYTLTLVVSYKDGDITLPIVVSNTIAKYILECCHEDDLFGIKGSIGIDSDSICVLLTNYLFYLKRLKMYLIRGDYKSGY